MWHVTVAVGGCFQVKKQYRSKREVGWILVQPRKRWANIEPTLVEQYNEQMFET